MHTDVTTLLSSMMPDTLVRMHDNAIESCDPDAAAAIRDQLVALVGEDEANAMLIGCEAPAPVENDNDEAVTAFMGYIVTANHWLEQIKQALDDHLGALPEEVDWAWVGSAAYVAEQLSAIVDCITNKE